MDLGMSEIKPIDLDALPKVWAWDDGKTDETMQGIYIKYEAPYGYGIFTMEFDDIQFFKHISETDPRIKTPKMRVMTAEELNDIYWEFGKDFRFKCDEDIHFSAFDWCVSEMQIVGCEYSTDRGKTWNKCEVPE